MNSNRQTTDSNRPLDEATLMRLVDDELAPDERRRVLLALDRDPSGWRRCGLAFLEDQVWQREIGRWVASQRQMGEVPQAVSVAPEGGRERRKGGPGRFSWQTLWALAATVLAAVSLGRLTQVERLPAYPPSHSVANSSQPFSPAVDPLSPQQVPSVPARIPSAIDQHVGPFFVSDHDFWERDSAIPQSVRRSLEKLGTEVRQQRGIVPVQLRDGRRVAVPYENVQLVPVGNTSY